MTESSNSESLMHSRSAPHAPHLTTRNPAGFPPAFTTAMSGRKERQNRHFRTAEKPRADDGGADPAAHVEARAVLRVPAVDVGTRSSRKRDRADERKAPLAA